MLLTDAPRTPELPPSIEPEEVTVGPVTLSAALWRILCDEADQNVAVLQHEVSILQFDPDYMPVVAMVRASHTLCGIHRTGGIALIATTARSLEQALLALEERSAPFPSTAQPILARATAGLAHFVERVKNREGFTPSDEREASDIEAELDEMRRDALADLPVDDPLIPPESAREFDMPLVADHDDPTPAFAADTTQPEVPVAEPQIPGADSPLTASAAESGAGAMLLTQWRGRDDRHAGAPVEHQDAVVASDGAAEPTLASAAPPEPFVEFRRSPITLFTHRRYRATAPPPVAIIEEAPALEQAWPEAVAPAPPVAATPTPMPVQRQVASDESLLDVTDDLDDTILAIFLEEAERALSAGERRGQGMASRARRSVERRAAAPHPAHAEGQRADGRRDAPRRARAPDGSRGSPWAT